MATRGDYATWLVLDMLSSLFFGEQSQRKPIHFQQISRYLDIKYQPESFKVISCDYLLRMCPKCLHCTVARWVHSQWKQLHICLFYDGLCLWDFLMLVWNGQTIKKCFIFSSEVLKAKPYVCIWFLASCNRMNKPNIKIILDCKVHHQCFNVICIWIVLSAIRVYNNDFF